MPPQGLTVLAALRPGAEEPLRLVLRAIGDDVRGRAVDARSRAHVDFSRSRNIHFARFAILDDPDRGAGRKRLLFSSNYDGDLDAHLAELAAITTDMPAIWGACEAYAGADRFPEFIRAHALQPNAFYIAFRDETVQTVQRRAAARGERDLRLAPPGPTGLQRIAAFVSKVVRAAPIVVDAIGAARRWGLANVFSGTQKINASLGRYPIFRFTNWLTRNRLPPRMSVYSSVALDNCPPWRPLAPGDEIPSSGAAAGVAPGFREDVVTQNQLTLVMVVDPRHVRRVGAVLAAIDAFASRLAAPGSLIGISTIHFVRWLLIDDGRRLVMLSDYDGSWESYIDEFAEMILSGLDAIWETSLGFPPDGARDLPAFKRFLRSHQVPAEVFFSAYPEQTVLNILEDLRLAGAGNGGGRAVYDGGGAGS